MIAALFSVLLFASDTSAAAAQAEPAPATQAAAEAPKEERKICKREAASESRLGSKKICRTPAEWKALNSGEAEYRRISK